MGINTESNLYVQYHWQETPRSFRLSEANKWRHEQLRCTVSNWTYTRRWNRGVEVSIPKDTVHSRTSGMGDAPDMGYIVHTSTGASMPGLKLITYPPTLARVMFGQPVHYFADGACLLRRGNVACQPSLNLQRVGPGLWGGTAVGSNVETFLHEPVRMPAVRDPVWVCARCALTAAHPLLSIVDQNLKWDTPLLSVYRFIEDGDEETNVFWKAISRNLF